MLHFILWCVVIYIVIRVVIKVISELEKMRWAEVIFCLACLAFLTLLFNRV